MSKRFLTNIEKINKLGKHGKVFTLEQFYSIVKELGVRNKKYKNQNAEFDSKPEEYFNNKFKRTGFIKVIRQIHLCSYPYKHKQYQYYPDFIALNKNGHIYVIEVKDYDRFASRDTMKKYTYAKAFCEQHGFIYVLTTKNLITYEDLKRSNIDPYVENTMKEVIKRRKKFTIYDYKDLIANRGDRTLDDIRREVVKCCIQNDYMMKHSLSKNSKKLCIKPHNL